MSLLTCVIDGNDTFSRLLGSFSMHQMQACMHLGKVNWGSLKNEHKRCLRTRTSI